MKIKKKAMCVYISRRWCIFYFFSGVQLAKRPAGEMLSSKRLDFFPSPNPTIVWPVCPLLTRWWPNHLFFLPPLFVPFLLFFFVLFCWNSRCHASYCQVAWRSRVAQRRRKRPENRSRTRPLTHVNRDTRTTISIHIWNQIAKQTWLIWLLSLSCAALCPSLRVSFYISINSPPHPPTGKDCSYNRWFTSSFCFWFK